MSLKTLYGLQSALLATSRPTGDLLIDYNKIVSKNQIENKKHLETYKLNSPHSPAKLISSPPKELLLPVNLIIFDEYYKRISEWKYLDKYQYDRDILVFNKKDYDWKKVSEEGSYKKDWLNNLTYLKDYKYLEASVYKYPQKDETAHINWISGGGSSHSLRSLLNLNLPQKIENSFEMHKKIIELDLSFLMSPVISIYSGYWKSGERNKSENVISQVEYGNLKANSVKWNDIYHYDRGKTKSCAQLGESEDNELKEARKVVKEGFDSQCDRINLLNFGSYFWRHNNRRIYSSGFVGYKYRYPAYWNTHFYFYSLGEWTLDKPAKYQVSEESEEKNLWYVNYDNLFVPEIKLIENPPKNKLGRKKFQLTFYLDYQKIKNIESFFRMSTKLSFKLKFKYKAKDYEKKFQIGDVLSGKQFYFEEDIGNKSVNVGSFSNFELIVYSENPEIKLQASSEKKEFSYAVNLSIVESRFNVLYGLLLDQEELKNFYYSELKNQEKLHQFFYLASKKSSDPVVKLIHLPSEWTKLLQLKLSGIDYSDSATLEYYDFIAGQDKKIELSNLLKLPTFNQEIYTRTDYSTPIEEIINKQNSHKIGSYFWSKMKLQLKEKDLFSGIEKYILQPRGTKTTQLSDWMDYYRGTEIVVQGRDEKYLVKNDQKAWDKTIVPSDYYKLFSISDNGRKKLGISVFDFTFTKTSEDNNELEIEATFKKNNRVRRVNSGGRQYDGVLLTGKTKFKWYKQQNSFKSDDFSSVNNHSPIKYYSSKASSSYSSRVSGNSWGDSKTFLPIVISGVGAGAGIVAGAGSLIFKKFKITSA